MTISQFKSFLKIQFSNGLASMTTSGLQTAFTAMLAFISDNVVGDIVAITNKATGGSIGSAATTVDITNSITVNQTTAAQALTLPSPTDAVSVHGTIVMNIGTTSFTMHGVTISAGGAMNFLWNGSAWLPIATTSFGAIVAAGIQNTGQNIKGTPVVITNKASGGAIGTAAATVDISNIATVNQTTASQALTLPAPTNATPIIEFTVLNIGSADFTMYGKTLKATGTGDCRATFLWSGSAWL